MKSTPPQQAPSPVEFIAHRGESFLAPENTMAAFDLAWKLGAGAVELDVHLTKDLRIAACHDPTLDRTGGQPLVIASSMFDELRLCDVGRWKDDRFGGERIPELGEVLKRLPPNGRLYIEVKSGPATIAPLAKIIQQSGKHPDQFILISFDAETLVEARRRLPNLKTFFIAAQEQREKSGEWIPALETILATAKSVRADGIDLSATTAITRSAVTQANNLGLQVCVWTVDDPAVARQMVEAGVTGITTNRADWLRRQMGSGSHPLAEA